MNEIPQEVKQAIKTLHDWCVGKRCSECPINGANNTYAHRCRIEEEPIDYPKELWK